MDRWRGVKGRRVERGWPRIRRRVRASFCVLGRSCEFTELFCFITNKVIVNRMVIPAGFGLLTLEMHERVYTYKLHPASSLSLGDVYNFNFPTPGAGTRFPLPAQSQVVALTLSYTETSRVKPRLSSSHALTLVISKMSPECHLLSFLPTRIHLPGSQEPSSENP